MLAGGCSGRSKASLEGMVTLGGQPLPGGAVRLFPAEGTPGEGAAAAVNDGRYVFPSSAGLFAGQYRVSVMGWKTERPAQGDRRHRVPSGIHGDPPEVIDPASGSHSLVPSQFNEQTTLTIVLRPGPNQKDWEL